MPSVSAVKRGRTPFSFSCCGPTLEALTASGVVNAAAPARPSSIATPSRPTTTTASHTSSIIGIQAQPQDSQVLEGSQAGRHITVSSSVPLGIGLGLGLNGPGPSINNDNYDDVGTSLAPSDVLGTGASFGSPLATHTNYTRGPSSNSGVKPMSSNIISGPRPTNVPSVCSSHAHEVGTTQPTSNSTYLE